MQRTCFFFHLQTQCFILMIFLSEEPLLNLLTNTNFISQRELVFFLNSDKD